MRTLCVNRLMPLPALLTHRPASQSLYFYALIQKENTNTTCKAPVQLLLCLPYTVNWCLGRPCWLVAMLFSTYCCPSTFLQLYTFWHEWYGRVFCHTYHKLRNLILTGKSFAKGFVQPCSDLLLWMGYILSPIFRTILLLFFFFCCFSCTLKLRNSDLSVCQCCNSWY